jgi:hypothetical protein
LGTALAFPLYYNTTAPHLFARWIPDETQLARKCIPAVKRWQVPCFTAKGGKAMLRKSVASLVVLVLVAGSVLAATLEGTLKNVDGDKNEVVVTDKDKKDVTVTVNKDAKITLDRKKAKLTDLKKDQTGKVTHEDNKAASWRRNPPKTSKIV